MDRPDATSQSDPTIRTKPVSTPAEDDTRPTRRIPLARTIARARLPHRGVAYRGGPPRQRGVARVPDKDEATYLLKPPGEAARPVFVDDSGRRGLLLAWAMVTLAVVALLLVAVFWFGQATSAAGAPPGAVVGAVVGGRPAAGA